MNSTKLSFEVDASQIDIKPILKKDFLELRMKAISTANPNRNNSWFTKESMEKSIDSFRNKPILGYFENGDFVSHNGEWSEDPETGMDYWDTLGKKGERILGLIRSEDEVKIVEDSKGLSWVTFSCALWTQYSYKQVKRLLQDAKRAKKNGGSAKNISVEVDITDYEYLENGVMKINAFNLIGVTILGSRNGFKVEPGIEDAELSVVDIMGKDLYERQAKGVRLAYERLDGSDKNKEDFSKMINENEETVVTEEATSTEATVTEESHEEHFEETTENTSESTIVSKEEHFEEDEKAPEDNKDDDHDDKDEDDDHDDDKDEDKEEGDEDNKKEDCACNKEDCACGDKKEDCACGDEGCDEKKEDCDCKQNCDCGECSEPERDPVRDVSWLISEASWNIESYNSSINYYENHEVAGKEYILPVLYRFKAQAMSNEAELAGLMAKLAAGYSEEDVQYEKELAEHCDCKELYKEKCELEAKCGKLESENKEKDEKLSCYAHEEFLKKADLLLKSAKISDEACSKFYAECKEGTIASIDDLKVKVALNMFDSQVKVEETETLDTPVANINTTAAFDGKAENSKKCGGWYGLREYIGK